MFNLFKRKDILIENTDGTFKYSEKNKGWTCVLKKYPNIEFLIKGYQRITNDAFELSPLVGSLNIYLSKYENYLIEAYKVLQDTIRNDETNKSFEFNNSESKYFKHVGVLFNNLEKHSFVLMFEDQGQIVEDMKGYLWSIHFTNGIVEEGVGIDS